MGVVTVAIKQTS